MDELIVHHDVGADQNVEHEDKLQEVVPLKVPVVVVADYELGLLLLHNRGLVFIVLFLMLVIFEPLQEEF